MSNKKYMAAALAVGLAASALTGQAAFANRSAAPSKPPVTQATHFSDLSGNVAVVDAIDPSMITEGSVTGELSLEVDQSGVTAPSGIVHANLNLGYGFEWVSASASVISDECDEFEENLLPACATPPTVGNPSFSYSGGTLSARDLSLRDVDGDGQVEFTLLAENADISTTVTTEGDYSVSSQYRTNPNRKTKEQTWVLSTSDAISLTSGPSCELDPAEPLSLELAFDTDYGTFSDYLILPFDNNGPFELVPGFDGEACVNGVMISYFDQAAGDTAWNPFNGAAPYAFGELAQLVSYDGTVYLSIQDSADPEADFFSVAGLRVDVLYGTDTYTFIRGLEPTPAP